MTTPKNVSVSHPLGRWLGAGLCALLLALSSAPLHAQQGGTVSGTVVDASTGKYLEGADVSVDGTSLHAVTAREGTFVLSDVPAGPHNITVSYPGLETKSSSVSVVAGQVASAPIRLGAGDVLVLSEFKVASTKEGMSEAIALQKLAVNSKVVAAGDQYGDIAEGNAAEYLKFLPGVGVNYNANDARAITLRGMSTAFTNVTMDGNPVASATSGNLNRRFEFEQVSISNVETIEVFKTLTPEMQATSTGGSINFVSKSAFDREGSLGTYRVYLQALNDDLTLDKTVGWGQEKTRKILPGIDVNYATRLSPNLGLNISYKNSQLFNDYPRSTYSWDYNPADGGTPTHPVATSWNMQNEQKDTRRQGFSTRVDYRLGDHTKLSLLGSWTFYDLIFTDRTTTVATGTLPALATTSTPNTGSTLVGAAGGKGSVTFLTGNRWKSGVTWDAPLTLTHDFANGAQLVTSAAWSQAYSKYRDATGSWYADSQIVRSSLNVTLNNIGQIAPNFSATTTAGAPVDLTDVSQFTANKFDSRPQTGVDTRTGFSADYKIPLSTTIPIVVKVGGRDDITGRNIENRTFSRTTFTTPVTGSQLVGMVDTNFSNHSIGYGLPAYNFISPYQAFTQLGGLTYLPYVPTSDTAARFDDTTKAGYVRFDVTPIEHFLIVGGVRYEDRETDTVNRQTNNAAFPTATSTFIDKRWYPSVNLKYTPTSALVFRFGYAKSIGLPDYSNLLPGPPAITDPANGARGKVSIYNPGLQAYQVDNFDTGVEYYFSQSGFVSASLFRKKFTNYINSVTQALTPATAAQYGITTASLAATPDQYDVTTQINVKDPGYYNGIEMSYSQNFGFLPKPFNTLNLLLNATLLSVDPIKTNTVFNNNPADPNLNAAILQQVNKNLEMAAVKQALNVELSYSIGKWAFVVNTNYTGHVLTALSQKTIKYTDVPVNQYYIEYQYQEPRELVDFRIDYKWNRKFTPYFQARNLFGRPIITGTPILPGNHAEYGDPIYEIGVRGIW